AAEPVKVSPAPSVKKVEEVKPPVPNVVATDDDMEDEPRRAHLVVDDPGVDENKPSQKAQSGLRLF
ncbi:MAG TPA: heme biosynthesis protein HemY, partial [Ochrobactrum anthropi]|nr:heme biosynthesis protein HemY [Brucella anthropi]